jgi:hypothetical protein
MPITSLGSLTLAKTAIEIVPRHVDANLGSAVLARSVVDGEYTHTSSIRTVSRSTVSTGSRANDHRARVLVIVTTTASATHADRLAATRVLRHHAPLPLLARDRRALARDLDSSEVERAPR